MRQDQFDRLMVLEEKLLDVYIEEIDTTTWPGAGIKPTAMDRDTRGDRYWTKRNSAATAALIVRTQHLIGNAQGFGPAPAPAAGGASSEEGEGEAELDRELVLAERQAEKLRSDLIKRVSKASSGKAAG